MICIDFETYAIHSGAYPPEPVGVAIWEQGRAEYLGWGHPCENNASRSFAYDRLAKFWGGSGSLLFHNAAFDLAVARLPWPSWDRIEDTQILAFLADPERSTTALKSLAEDLLGEKPTERDDLRDWILEHVDGATRKTWGAYIAHAPGSLVARYAVGDVKRTMGLYRYFRQTRKSLLEAYNRERRMLGVAEGARERGVPVVRQALGAFVDGSVDESRRLERFLLRRLQAPSSLDLGSRSDLADALEKRGLVKKWERTLKTQERKTAIDSLRRTCSDQKLVDGLHQLSLRKTLTDTAETWLALSAADRRVHPIWNLTRRVDEARWREAGARTGRMSSTPNLQNVPKAPEYPGLPNPREWIGGSGLVAADYSQQEFRILAHYENGALARLYREDPDLDIHGRVRDLVNARAGVPYSRDALKSTGFGILYGRGAAAVGAALGLRVEEAAMLRSDYYAALPGIRSVQQWLRKLAARGEPFDTWGGRRYYCEAPQVVDGRDGPEVTRSFEYKMLNTLIQGSAADHLKESAIALFDAGFPPILFVHDELVVATKRKTDARRIREVLESVGTWRVPMRAGAKWGKTWADAK